MKVIGLPISFCVPPSFHPFILSNMSFPSNFFFPTAAVTAVTAAAAPAPIPTGIQKYHIHITLMQDPTLLNTSKNSVLRIRREGGSYLCHFNNRDTDANFQWMCPESTFTEYLNLFFSMIFVNAAPPKHVQFDCCMLPGTVIPVAGNQGMCEIIIKHLYSMMQSFNRMGWPTPA